MHVTYIRHPPMPDFCSHLYTHCTPHSARPECRQAGHRGQGTNLVRHVYKCVRKFGPGGVTYYIRRNAVHVHACDNGGGDCSSCGYRWNRFQQVQRSSPPKQGDEPYHSSFGLRHTCSKQTIGLGGPRVFSTTIQHGCLCPATISLL